MRKVRASTRSKTMTSIPQAGVDYDIAHESIKCNADKIGARIFEVEDYFSGITRRVLAYSKEDAHVAVNGFPSCSDDR